MGADTSAPGAVPTTSIPCCAPTVLEINPFSCRSWGLHPLRLARFIEGRQADSIEGRQAAAHTAWPPLAPRPQVSLLEGKQDLVDFGSAVIPHAVESGLVVQALQMSGSWRDVGGSIGSYYNARCGGKLGSSCISKPRTFSHTHTHVHTCANARTHTHPHTHVLAHTYTHTHARTRTHTHAHMHTHTHTHAHAQRSMEMAKAEVIDLADILDLSLKE